MRTRTVLFIIALTFLALPLFAQEATIQFDGEKAEAVSSFSWGVSQSRLTTGEGGSAGRASMSDFSFTKPVTQLSNSLLLGCTTGKHFTTVVLKVKKKGKDKNQEYLVVTMSDVLVSSYRVTGGKDEVADTTSLTYGNVEYLIVP